MATLGAFAAIIDAGRLLLVEQAYAPFRWTQPGGRVEEGELPHDAVIREVKEETGLDVTVDHLIGVYYAAYKNDLVFHFSCKPANLELVLPPQEIKQAGFFGPNELPGNLAFNTRVRAQDAFSRLRPQLRVFPTAETLGPSFFLDHPASGQGDINSLVFDDTFGAR